MKASSRQRRHPTRPKPRLDVRIIAPLSIGPTSPAVALPICRPPGEWALCFAQWYNHEHRNSGIRYVTPAQRHADPLPVSRAIANWDFPPLNG